MPTSLAGILIFVFGRNISVELFLPKKMIFRGKNFASTSTSGRLKSNFEAVYTIPMSSRKLNLEDEKASIRNKERRNSTFKEE